MHDYLQCINLCSGPGSSVGITTGYGLDGPGIESRLGARFSAPVQTGPGAHPASCTMGTGSFPGVKYGRGVLLTTHPLLVPWSWKGRAIPLLPVWAVRPVQSLSACTRVHFTFTFTFCKSMSTASFIFFTYLDKTGQTRQNFHYFKIEKNHFTGAPFRVQMPGKFINLCIRGNNGPKCLYSVCGTVYTGTCSTNI
jgi:hypothetical protein